METVEKDLKKSEYLRRFEKQVHPTFLAEDKILQKEIIETGEKVLDILKTQEMTYVDAYITLEYVYRKLKFNSEYTHL